MLGRAAFLGVVGAGLAGLFLGRDAMRLAGRVVPDSVEAIVPTSGWRIYTIADLRALPRVEQVSDFHCVTGWSVDDVRWAGVRFRDLLAGAGIRPDARALRLVSGEVPYDDTLTLSQAFAPDALLAVDMDGAPLTEPHGFPVRAVMPRMYGYKNVKWVTRIEVQTSLDHVGYWEQGGYDEDAWVGDSNGL